MLKCVKKSFKKFNAFFSKKIKNCDFKKKSFEMFYFFNMKSSKLIRRKMC